jgi:hypothetical protein
VRTNDLAYRAVREWVTGMGVEGLGVEGSRVQMRTRRKVRKYHKY